MQARVIPQPGQVYPDRSVKRHSGGPLSKKVFGNIKSIHGKRAKANTLALAIYIGCPL